MDLELVAPSTPRKPVRDHSTLRDKLRSNHSDHFQTPPEAIEYLLPFIGDWQIIWDPACGNGNILAAFAAKGYRTTGSDISDGYDFFLAPNRVWENTVHITNPPYSIKDRWIEECYRRSEPFALLMPLTALEGVRRQACWRQGMQLMILPKRMNFETPNMGKLGSGSHFATAWFTRGLNLPSDLYFAEEPK